MLATMVDVPFLNPAISTVDSTERQLLERIRESTEAYEELKTTKKEQEETIELLQTLPTKLRHKVVVPLGPQAFFQGELVHTNEALVGLGDAIYVQRTAANAIHTLERRKQRCERSMEEVEKVLLELKAEAGLASELKSSVSGEGVDEVQAEAEKPDMENASIRKTAEGFIEIREAYESDEEEGSEACGAVAAASHSTPVYRESSGAALSQELIGLNLNREVSSVQDSRNKVPSSSVTSESQRDAIWITDADMDDEHEAKNVAQKQPVRRKSLFMRSSESK